MIIFDNLKNIYNFKFIKESLKLRAKAICRYVGYNYTSVCSSNRSVHSITG